MITLKGAIKRISDTVNMLDREVGKTNLYMALQMAIKALVKQIPKKVTNSVCPSCNRIFLFRHGEKRKGNYCDNCGQVLDWSDTE